MTETKNHEYKNTIIARHETKTYQDNTIFARHQKWKTSIEQELHESSLTIASVNDVNPSAWEIVVAAENEYFSDIDIMNVAKNMPEYVDNDRDCDYAINYTKLAQEYSARGFWLFSDILSTGGYFLTTKGTIPPWEEIRENTGHSVHSQDITFSYKVLGIK